MGTTTFLKNTSRRFYSTYRPIDIWVMNTDNDIAFMRGELYIEVGAGSGSFVSTGATSNGHTIQQNGSSWTGFYDFNVMEYCRHYVGVGLCPVMTWGAYFLPGYAETNTFFFRTWPVRYSALAIGQLWDDTTESVDSMHFIATPANLHHNTATATDGRNLFLDHYVLGQNGLAGIADTVSPLTHVPNSPSPIKNRGFHIHMWDHPADSLYTYWNQDKKNRYLFMIVARYNNGVDISGFDIVGLPHGYPAKIRIPVHPITLSAWMTILTGSSYYSIVNSSGNLICKKIAIITISGNNLGGNTVYWSTREYGNQFLDADYRYINYSDETVANHDDPEAPRHDIKQAKCERTKFLFQNSLGGFDWFSCYGTHEKSVSLSGTQYDKHLENYMRENHTRTWLTTNREDNYKVTSQPIDKATADWLSELYTSPKVWVQTEYLRSDIKHWQGLYRLTPILIKPDTFQLYNTDDNTYFMEFEYTYSEQKTQPKG